MSKSIEWLLVDGYNLIHELYKPEEEENLEELRNSLVEVLLNFGGYHLLRIQIVFDGKGLQLDKEKILFLKLFLLALMKQRISGLNLRLSS